MNQLLEFAEELHEYILACGIPDDGDNLEVFLLEDHAQMASLIRKYGIGGFTEGE